jgi:hypothetical protein
MVQDLKRSGNMRTEGAAMRRRESLFGISDGDGMMGEPLDRRRTQTDEESATRPGGRGRSLRDVIVEKILEVKGQAKGVGRRCNAAKWIWEKNT